MVAGQQSRVEILFTEFETSTDYETFADCVNHLQAILLAKTLKAIVYSLKEGSEVTAMVFLHEEVKLLDFDPGDAGLANLVCHDLLAVLEASSHNLGNQDVNDTLQFLEFFDPAILSDKLDFAAHLVLVSVVDPKNDVADHDEGHPRELEGRRVLLGGTFSYQ